LGLVCVSPPLTAGSGPKASLGHHSKSDRTTDCLVLERVLHSTARNKTTRYLVFIPRSAKKEKKPVLLLLHGAWDDYKAWNARAGDLLKRLAAEEDIIILTPDGEPFGWYADSAVTPDQNIETYFMDELIPHIRKTLPCDGRFAIAGLSMGGHGAMVLALRNPGIFASASSMSGILDITRHPGQWKLPLVFGPFAGERVRDWRDHSALELIQRSSSGLENLALMVSVSSEDEYSRDENRDFHAKLDELGKAHVYRAKPGGHDWKFWISELPRHVRFHAGVIYSKNTGEPTRLLNNLSTDP